MEIIYAARVLGTPDHDRCNALSKLGHNVTVLLFPKALEYVWDLPTPPLYSLISVKPGTTRWTKLKGAITFVKSALSLPSGILLVYGYQEAALLAAAVIWRVLGRTVLSLNDSKFDDYDRRILRDLAKLLLLLPYRGVVAASERAAAYARYFGKRTSLYYCAIDVERVAGLAKQSYSDTSFKNRAFVMVARFVKKKNHHFILDAYEKYLALDDAPRNLNFVGYGALENETKARVNSSASLVGRVRFLGYKTSAEIPSILGASLALLLPSTEEQFGIVATEALASGIPVILSSACGANDLIDNNVNGFSLSLQSTDAWAKCMVQLSRDPQAWENLSEEAAISANIAGASSFCQAIAELLPSKQRGVFEGTAPV